MSELSPSTSGAASVRGGAYDIVGTDDLYETMSEYMLLALELTRDTIRSYLDTMKSAERSKAEKVIEQIDDYLVQLKKSKEAGGLAKFFNALGALGVALAMISAVVIPSPMTLAMLVVTVAMFLEPMISDAAGQESLIAQGMGALIEALSESMDPAAAAVLGTIILLLVMLAITKGTSSGFSVLGSSSNVNLQAARQFFSELPKVFSRLVGSNMNSAQSMAFKRFLEYAEATTMAAQGAVQVPMAKLQYEAAILMAEFKFDDVKISVMSSIIESIGQDLANERNFLDDLESRRAQFSGAH